MRKRSTIKGMNGGAFVELQTLYDENHGDRPFDQNSKETIKKTVEKLDSLIKLIGDSSSSQAGSEGSGRKQVEQKSGSQNWMEMSDPNTGGVYYYNTVTGASSWEKPE